MYSNQKIKISLLLSFILNCILVYLLLNVRITDLSNQNCNNQADTDQFIYVDLKGEVLKPGVYKVEEETRLFTLLGEAGGLTEKANESRINFALKLEDEMIIVIPSKDESSLESLDKISINFATSEELQTLNGIGETKANSIVRYREEYGMFKKIEDLLNVPGIGEATLNKLKDHIML